MPLDVTPFTPVIPLAGSGASSPLSAASTASLRTAVIETSLIYATKQQDLAELFWSFAKGSIRIPSAPLVLKLPEDVASEDVQRNAIDHGSNSPSQPESLNVFCVCVRSRIGMSHRSFSAPSEAHSQTTKPLAF